MGKFLINRLILGRAAMKVVILCGGFGTRIRDVADNIPKPMIPVGGRPILWHIMKTYAQAGFKDFVLCLGYKGQVIKDFFLNYEAHTNDCTLHLGGNKPVEFLTDHSEADWRVTLVETGANANTGARVRRIRKYVEADEHFMLTYGDGLGTVDIKSLVSYHKEHGRILTVTGVRPPSRFGEIVADEQGAIVLTRSHKLAVVGSLVVTLSVSATFSSTWMTARI